GDESAVERVAALGEPAVPRLLDLLRQDGPAPLAGQALARMLDGWPKGDPRSARVGSQLADEYESFAPAGRHAVLKLAEPLAGSEPATRLVQLGLKDSHATNREAAVRLAMRPEINLAAAVVPLLADLQPDVRRIALRFLGGRADLATDEKLLPLLHDPEADLRTRCELILRGRGLRDKDLQLGRM